MHHTEVELSMDSLFFFLTQTVTAGATVIAIIVLALAFLIGLKMVSGGKRRRNQDEEHARLAQEMYRTLDAMDQRLEALETLLLDRDGSRAERPKEDGREPR